VAEKLSWVFEGVDRFTGPVGGMSTSIVKLAFGLNEAKDLLVSFGHALEFVGEKGLHFGEMALDALAFKEATLNSFEVMLGTREQAHKMFNEAQAFADLTPFKTADVIGSFQQLSATFKENEVPIVFQAVADVASFAGTREQGQEIIRTLTSDIQRMYAYGKATQRDLIPILNAGRVAGLSPEKFFKGLADVLGTDVATATAKYHAGMVDANLGTVALLRTIKNITGMELGGAVIKQATTINGLISTSKSLMENFFFSMSKEAEDLAGVNAFKGSLRNVIGYFNVLTPTGQRVAHSLERVFSGAFTAIFGGFAGAGGAERIKATMERILNWMDSVDWNKTFGGLVTTLTTTGSVLWSVFSGFASVLGPVLKGIFSLFGMANATGALSASLAQMGKVLGIVVGALLVMAVAATAIASPVYIIVAGIIAWWSAINSLMDVDWGFLLEQIKGAFSAMGSWFTETWPKFKEWGLSVIYGIGDGITAGVGWLVEKVSGAGSAIMTAFKEKLGIHSPSTVFAEYGENTTEGYVQGVEGGLPDVSRAFDGLLDGRGGAAGEGPGGGGVTINFGEGAFAIDARGGMDAETFARRLQEILPSALTPAFERMAMSTGGL
jgi:hypothetical protein